MRPRRLSPRQSHTRGCLGRYRIIARDRRKVKQGKQEKRVRPGPATQLPACAPSGCQRARGRCMRPEFVDNRNGNTLVVALRGHLDWLAETYAEAVELSVATGYFNPEGFVLIADRLERLPKVRLLLGAEPTPPPARPIRKPGDPRAEARARISRGHAGPKHRGDTVAAEDTRARGRDVRRPRRTDSAIPAPIAPALRPPPER